MRKPAALLGVMVAGVALLASSPRADPSRTTFQIEHKNGRPVAVFAVQDGGRRYEGLLLCEGGQRLLAIMLRDRRALIALEPMTKYRAEFIADGRTLVGAATYVPQTGAMPAIVFFAVPLLDGQSFAGSGLALKTIANPRRSGASPADRAPWDEAVADLRFHVIATNGEEAASIVFHDCPKQ